MNLGEDQAKSLGVNYSGVMNRSLIFISILIAVSTALVGPLMFLGLITVNLAREILQKAAHKPIFIMASVIGVIFWLWDSLYYKYLTSMHHWPF